MGKLVDVEGIGRVEFPDDYTPEQIQAVWQREFKPILDRREEERGMRARVERGQRAAQEELPGDLEAGFRGAGDALLSAGSSVGRAAAKTLTTPLRAAGTIADVIRSKVGDIGSFETTPGDKRSALVQAADYLDKKAEEYTPGVKPEYEQQFVAGDVASGLGNVGAMLLGGGAAGLAAKGLGKAALPAAVAGATTLGFTAEFDDAFKRSTARGDNPDLALAKALGYGTVAAMIESGLGAGRLLRKIMPDPKAAATALGKAGVAKEALKNVIAGYGEEALQRASQDLIVDGKLDPEAINREGLAGAVVQGLIGLPAIRQTQGPPPLPKPQPPTPAAVPAATPPSTPAAGVAAPAPRGPVPPPPLPNLSGAMLNTPIQSWMPKPGAPHVLAQSPDTFGIGNQVVKLSQSGGGFGRTGMVVGVTGPNVDGNPNPTVTVRYDDGTTQVSGFREFGFAENFAEAVQAAQGVSGKPFAPDWQPPTPRITPSALPPKTDSKRVAPLGESEQLVQRIAEARARGDKAEASRLSAELDFLGKPRAEAAMETRSPAPLGLQRGPVITPEITEAAQAALNYDPRVPVLQRAEPGALRAMRREPTLPKNPFTEAIKNKSVRMDGGSWVLPDFDALPDFGDAPKNVDKIPDGPLPDGTEYVLIDKRFSGNPRPFYAFTPQGLVYEYERGMSGISPWRLFGSIGASVPLHPEATMQTRPTPELGLQREPAVSPELADTIKAIREGYVPRVEGEAPVNITSELFKQMDKFASEGDQIGVHTMKRLIEGRPRNEVEAALDLRLSERELSSPPPAQADLGAGAASPRPPASPETKAPTAGKTSSASLAAQAGQATEAWGKFSVEVVEPLRKRVKEAENLVRDMQFDAARMKPGVKPRERLTLKAFLAKYGAADKDAANAMFRQRQSAWEALRKELDGAEAKLAELNRIKEKAAQDWSRAVTREKEAQVSSRDPRLMSDAEISAEIELNSQTTAPLYAALDRLGDDAYTGKGDGYTDVSRPIAKAIEPFSRRSEILKSEQLRRQQQAQNRVNATARDKRVAEAAVFQRRNGWEIVKDGFDYVLRDPSTKEDIYRGKLSRVREVADESSPQTITGSNVQTGTEMPVQPQAQAQAGGTPLQRQWLDLKAKHPSGVLAVRLGDFYEFFFEDAKTAASILKVALTKRGEMQMAGVPYHAADQYFSKLRNAGKDVHIVDAVGEPPQRVVTETLPAQAGGVTPQRDKSKPEQMTAEEFNGQVWYQGVAGGSGEFVTGKGLYGKSPWVTQRPAKARDYATRRKTSGGRVDIYTDELLGEGAWNGEDGPIDPVEYRKTNEDQTLQSPETTQPLASVPIEQAERAHQYLTEGAVSKNLPVSASAVDTYGIKLPPGYVREGELYVYRPEGGLGTNIQPNETTRPQTPPDQTSPDEPGGESSPARRRPDFLWGSNAQIEAALARPDVPRVVRQGAGRPRLTLRGLRAGPQPQAARDVPQVRVFVSTDSLAPASRRNAALLAERIFPAPTGAQPDGVLPVLRGDVLATVDKLGRAVQSPVVFAAEGQGRPLAETRPLAKGGSAIFFNTDKLGDYDLTDPATLAMLDQVVLEEFIHAAAVKLVSPREAIRVWASLNDKEKKAVRKIYNRNGTNEQRPYNLGHEYLRMVLQERLFGQTTEQTQLRITAPVRKFLRKMVNFLKNAFGAKPKEDIARQVIERLEGAIRGEAPIQGSVMPSTPPLATSISNENYRWQTDPQRVARDLAGRRDVLRVTQAELQQVFADAYDAGVGQQPATAGQSGRAGVSAVPGRAGAQAFQAHRVFLPTGATSPAARQNAEILALRFLQGAGRSGQRVFQPVREGDFVHALGEKTGAKLVFRPLVGEQSENYAQFDRLPGVGDFISINTNRLGELDFNTQSASFDAILSEELLHLVTMRLSSDAEVAAAWQSLSPKEQESTIRAYGKSGLSDTQLGAEYIRMVIQQRLEGRVTEETGTLTGRVRAILRDLLDFLYAEFGKKPKDALARAIVERIEGAVQGDAPIQGSVFGGAPLATSIGQAVPQPTFHSRLIRTVEQSQQNRASGAQWKATIKNSKLGANTDEMALVGVNDLEDGKTYTKQEVLDYLSANQVVVKDVTLGADAPFAVEYSPSDGVPGKPYVVWNRKTGDIVQAYATKRQADDYVSQVGSLETHFSTYQLPGAKEGSYREVLLTVPQRNPFNVRAYNAAKTSEERDQILNAPRGATWTDGHSQYSSIANPIVRLRFNERTTQDGKRMLFLEEVQAPQKGEFEKMPPLFQKNWRGIAFKWALRHAAENGFSVVGWTTGAQQAERYDLSKQIERIDWTYNGSEWEIQATTNTGSPISSFRDKPEELDEVVGKELADRIRSATASGGKSGSFSGLDLKVGGEGLKKLYDVDFRNVVNGLPAVRKAGQKVGASTVTTGTGMPGVGVYAGDPQPTAQVHSLTITPEIAASVMGGQPLASLGAPAPRTAQPSLSVKQVTEALFPFGLGGLPKNTEVTHRLDILHTVTAPIGKYNSVIRTLDMIPQEFPPTERFNLLNEDGETVGSYDPSTSRLDLVEGSDVKNGELLFAQIPRTVKGWYNPETRKLWLNAAYITTPEEARATLVEEAFHAVQNDPKVKNVMGRLLSSLTPAQLAEAESVYGIGERARYEAVAGIIEQESLSSEQRSLLEQLWTALMDAISKLFGMVNPDWISVETDARTMIAHALRSLARGQATNVSGKPWMSLGEIPGAEKLAVDAASEQVAAQGEQLYADLEAGARSLENTAYQAKLFRSARAELNRLAQLAEGRLRQIPDAPPEAQPDPTEGVAIVNGQVVADSSFSDKLNALGIQHNPEQAKAAREAIFFEQHAKNTLATRDRLADWQARLAYYRQIGAPAKDIQRIETTIKSNQTRLAKMEAAELNGQTAGQRADELAAAEGNALEARAKLEAMQLEPVNDFFGERLSKLKALLEKGVVAANLRKAMMQQTTDPEQLKVLTEEFEQYERLPALAKSAMNDGVMTEDQRAAIIAALEASMQEFDVARSQMNNLLSNEQAKLLKDIEAQSAEFNAGSQEKVEARTAIDAALRAVKKSETGLIDSVARAAQVDNLVQHTEALSGMAVKLGETLEQNRWLYDYLSGWSDTPGLPVFTKANADALGVSEDVLRDAMRIAKGSPAFGSAIVSIADAAAAQRAASLPLQLQGVVQDPQQAAAVIAMARQQLNSAGGKQSVAANQLAKSIQRLMALNYGASLFNQVATNPALKAMRDQLDDDPRSPRAEMYASSNDSETYLEFGDPKKNIPHAKQIVVNVAEDPAMKRQVQERIWNWVVKAQEYVAGYEAARAIHATNPNAPSPEDAGYSLPVVRGLKHALPGVLTTNFDPSLLNPGQRLKPSWVERKLLKTFIFKQHDRIARMVGGEIGLKLRAALGGWVKGNLNAKTVTERFQTLPEITAAALKSHSKPGSQDHLFIENYRQRVWNQMAHLGRRFGTALKAGFQLPSGEVVTKEDIALLDKEIAYGESMRREVTEVDGGGGVRYTVNGKTMIRPGASVGDKGMARHLSGRSTPFIADVQNAYADGGFDASDDLSPAATKKVVQFWNQRTDMLRDHVFDSTRDDRSLKLDPLMRQAESALADRWQAAGVAQVDSLSDLAQQLAAELPPTGGISPLTYVIQHLNTELRSYERKAKEIQDTRAAEAARTTGLKIALSADNEYTKPAALLELPSSLYNYGALTTAERVGQQSRANHERLVNYANALRRAINELGVRLREANQVGADKKLLASAYGGDLNEMQDVKRAMEAVLKDFEDAFSAYSPAMLPSGIPAELAKTPVGAVLALFTTNLRNLSLGQMQAYLANEAMGYMGSRMAMLEALKNVPKALTRTAYIIARSMATRLDPSLGANSKTLEKLVEAMAPIVLSPLQFSAFNPQQVRAEMNWVRGLGFDTRGSLRESYRQIKAGEAMFDRAEELEFAQNYPRLEAARKGAAVGVKSINATLGKVGVENTDQVINSLNLVASHALENHLEDVAMVYGKRLEDEGITKFEAFNPKLALMPIEWTREKSLQAAADSLATTRLMLESSAGGEGFQLEQALLNYYNEVKAGRQADVFTGAQREAVQRRLLAEMNTSLPTNRASASAASPVLRALLTLNGYPADAMLKIIGVAFSGTRDRRTVATIGAKLPLLTRMALMALVIGAAAGAATEWWKRYIQGVHTSRAGVLDKDFWTDPSKFASGVTGYIASNLSYLGDAILAMQNQIQGNRGFEISQKAFYLSFLQALTDAVHGSFVTAKGAGSLGDIIQPFVDLSTRMTPGGLELRRAFGKNRDLNTSRQITAAEARAAGMEMPKAGASPMFGPTTLVRRRLASAVGAMADARQSGDQQAYNEAKAEAQEQIAKLTSYYKEQWIGRGDTEEVATKKAAQAVWNDYQEANPVVAALGGRRPTQAQVEMLTSGATGSRGEAQRKGIQAWQDGAQALFGRSAGTSKEEVKAMRSSAGGAANAPSAPSPAIPAIRFAGRSRGRRLSLRPRRISTRGLGRSSLGRTRLRRLSRPRATGFKRLKLSV